MESLINKIADDVLLGIFTFMDVWINLDNLHILAKSIAATSSFVRFRFARKSLELVPNQAAPIYWFKRLNIFLELNRQFQMVEISTEERLSNQ